MKDRKNRRMTGILALIAACCVLPLTACAGIPAGESPAETTETAEPVQEQKLTYELKSGFAVITGVETKPAAGESLRLPEAIEGLQVQEIAAEAFAGLDCLADTTFPLPLQKIGASACKGSNIRRIGIAHAAQLNVGTEAFADCAELNAVSLNDSNAVFGEKAFAGSAVESISSSGGSFELGASAAEGCEKLASIDLSGSAVLQASCCAGCKALQSFVLTDAPEFTIGERAFAESGLKHAVVRTSSGQAAGEAFAGCTSLESAEFDEGLAGLGERAFAGCTALTKVVLPASLTVIGEDCFADCPNVYIFAPEGSFALQYAQEHGLNASQLR